ncbi:MAG: hypothetical protein AB7P69_23310 [Candidatus Binatia bacterium]
MTRNLWDRFMIMLMGVVILFGIQEIWKDPSSPDMYRYALSIGIATLVIVLKIKAMRKSAAEQMKKA